MYAGSTLKHTQRFDAWFGAHQKIDRTARRHLQQILPKAVFPTARQILRFEGMDGPDGIKRKTPAQDEPWHYYDPENADDKQIIELIEGHYRELVRALKGENTARAAFEAAWLAHALVDGLTPAHHYPYEAELTKLRGGAGIETRTTPKEKLLMPGENLRGRVSNNWKMWGDKGLLATHFAFEWGVAVMIIPLRLARALPAKADRKFVREQGVAKLFQARAKQIANLHMYEQFYKSGWTPRLAKQVRRELVPTIASTVTLAWYAAAREAAGK
jgi:hypothetical protein